MGIRGDESDLEGCSIGSLLEYSVSSADPGVGTSEDDNVLHFLGRYFFFACLLETVGSEEVKDNEGSLLEGDCGGMERQKSTSHCN